MSPSTPRKGQTRHPLPPNYIQQQYQQQPHGHTRARSQQVQAEALQQQFTASDYESDTAQYMASHPAKPVAALAARTNTELNMSVISRYVPSITSILSIAANAVLYTFEPPSEWKRMSMLEGTMFICSQGEHAGEVSENGCLFILNRKGLDNLTIDLTTIDDFELSNDLLIFKLSPAADVTMKLETGTTISPEVLGIWTYAEEDSERQTNAALIYEMWSKVREAREKRASASAASSDPLSNQPGVTGRKVELSELFSTQHR
ncbi:PH domain-like protein [Xylariaceae sp. FL1272]|nr:PH domain-like protein [Xylariaceae sp. FL1272]